ncbi:Peroxiredoxin-2 [Balamuthia mandrillaris]
MSQVKEASVGQAAPAWEEQAVVNGEFKTLKSSDFLGKYLVLFFYPLDWTFVCPTEILSFSDRAEEFRKIGCEVVGVSVDSVYSHLAWINTPRKSGGLGGSLNIPLVADLRKKMSQAYGVLLEEEGISLRGLFIIDKEGKVQQITKNAPPVGRSVDETLRLVQAFQYTEEHGEVCPVNWTPGSLTMKPDPQGSKGYFEKVNQ